MEMIIKSGLGGYTFQPAGFANRTVFDTNLPTCFRQAQHLFIKGYQRIATSILQLFSAGRPSTVVFTIPKLVVMTIQFMEWRRATTHVSKKIRKFFPFVTDGNTTTAIMFETLAIRIQRTINHALPSHILRSSPGASTVPVFSSLSFQTPARHRMPHLQIVRMGDSARPAIASAKPSWFTRWCVPSTFNNRQLPKPLMCKIKELHMGNLPHMAVGVQHWL